MRPTGYSPVPIPLKIKTFIPAGIDNLSPAAFIGDPALVEEIVFEAESHIRVIHAGAFGSFESLKAILIPASVDFISQRCFAGLNLLGRVRFEARSRLRFLGEEAFLKCGCRSSEIEQQVKRFLTYFQPLADDGGWFPAVEYYQLLRDAFAHFDTSAGPRESIAIPASVESIGACCFAYTTSFSSITFEPGSKLQTMDCRAFFGCAIRSIVIPHLVEIIPEGCFLGCQILSGIAFENGSRLQKIRRLAFSACGVESIQIPELVSAIKPGCFVDSRCLRDFTFDVHCVVGQLDRSTLCWCASLKAICIPASVKIIGEWCFAFCQRLTSVTFQSGSKLSAINQRAFLSCPQLGPSIQLPAALGFLGNGCFEDCPVLLLIAFEPNSALCHIGSFPFRRCALESFQIPASLGSINWSCFFESGARTQITFESPSRLKEIFHFDPGTAREFSMPDSVISMHVARGDFVCNFGRDSQLQMLVIGGRADRRVGFMRLSEPSLKRIRLASEWSQGSAHLL
jgi:hypothetical protein